MILGVCPPQHGSPTDGLPAAQLDLLRSGLVRARLGTDTLLGSYNCIYRTQDTARAAVDVWTQLP